MLFPLLVGPLVLLGFFGGVFTLGFDGGLDKGGVDFLCATAVGLSGGGSVFGCNDNL